MKTPSTRWSFWQIPAWREDERLRRFYRHCFGLEAIHEIGACKSYAADGSPFAHRLRGSLEYLLEQQPASTKDWLSLTGFQFFSERDLYGYLLGVYEYFYRDRKEPPVAPHSEAPPPEEHWR
ncbi:hypothetical protein [Streptomyces nigrescens]|uniref:hypothetical protein n=1 Tax=Streptomyces nigrescens TaxID=1920 RepID=UPI0036C94060